MKKLLLVILLSVFTFSFSNNDVNIDMEAVFGNPCENQYALDQEAIYAFGDSALAYFSNFPGGTEFVLANEQFLLGLAAQDLADCLEANGFE